MRVRWCWSLTGTPASSGLCWTWTSLSQVNNNVVFSDDSLFRALIKYDFYVYHAHPLLITFYFFWDIGLRQSCYFDNWHLCCWTFCWLWKCLTSEWIPETPVMTSTVQLHILEIGPYSGNAFGGIESIDIYGCYESDQNLVRATPNTKETVQEKQVLDPTDMEVNKTKKQI